MDFEYAKLFIFSIILGVLIGIGGAAFMLGVNLGSKLIWEIWLPRLGNPTWLLVLLSTLGGVLVGFCVKFFGANKGTGIESVMEEAEVQGGLSLLQIPRVVLNSFIGLITSASIGPESAIMVLGGYVGTVFGKKFKMELMRSNALVTVAFGSALGSILEAPSAGSLLLTERSIGSQKIHRQQFLYLILAILVSSSFGYGIFLLFMGPIALHVDFIPSYGSFRFIDLIYGILLGILGAFVGIFSKKVIVRVTQFCERFDNQPVLRSTSAGLISGLIGLAFPLAMFSGENQLHEVVGRSAELGFVGLAVLGLAKIITTAVAFGGRYQGGNIFPTLFIGGTIGLAVHFLLPFIPVAVAMASVMMGTLLLVFRLPIFSILLVGILGSSISLAPILAVSCGGALVIMLRTRAVASQSKSPAPISAAA